MFIKETINGVEINISDINFLTIVRVGNKIQAEGGEFLLHLCADCIELDGISYDYEWWCNYSNFGVMKFIMDSISEQMQDFNF